MGPFFAIGVLVFCEGFIKGPNLFLKWTFNISVMVNNSWEWRISDGACARRTVNTFNQFPSTFEFVQCKNRIMENVWINHNMVRKWKNFLFYYYFLSIHRIWNEEFINFHDFLNIMRVTLFFKEFFRHLQKLRILVKIQFLLIQFKKNTEFCQNTKKSQVWRFHK